jgi:transcriptional regulator with XRE-family HTH domain
MIKDMTYPEGLGPAVQRAILIEELKQLRAAAGLTQAEVAADREWSISKFTRMENGTTPIGKSDLEGLLRLYGVTDPERTSEMFALAAGAQEKGWWEEYYSGPDKAYEAYLGYEDGASSIHMFQGLAIPGLLQTEAYARKLEETFNLPPALIERSVRLRLERQKRMAAKAPEQHYIVDEVVFRRPVGDVMPDQLRHLQQVARKQHVSLRILPLRAGMHFGLRGAFVLLGFGKLMPDVLYLEGVRRGDLLVAERGTIGAGAGDILHPFDEIATYQDGYNDLLELALEPEESMDLISAAIRDLEG